MNDEYNVITFTNNDVKFYYCKKHYNSYGFVPELNFMVKRYAKRSTALAQLRVLRSRLFFHPDTVINTQYGLYGKITTLIVWSGEGVNFREDPHFHSNAKKYEGHLQTMYSKRAIFVDDLEDKLEVEFISEDIKIHFNKSMVNKGIKWKYNHKCQDFCQKCGMNLSGVHYLTRLRLCSYCITEISHDAKMKLRSTSPNLVEEITAQRVINKLR